MPKDGFEWQRGAEDDRYLWKQQVKTALSDSKGFSASLLVLGEISLDLADTRPGRILISLVAVTIAWALI